MDEQIKIVVPYNLGDGMEDTSDFETELCDALSSALFQREIDNEVVVEWRA